MPALSSDNRRVAVFGLLVFLTTFALFSPSIGYDFIHLDDGEYVTENPHVQNGFSLDALKGAWTETAGLYWAPLLWMSFMLDVELFGLNPWGFHLVNVLLFSLNSLLVFWLMWRWTGRVGVALATALLWAWHPARVESVAWVAERKDVLSGLFLLLGLGAYVENRRGRLKYGMAIAWVCMLLGGMVKQIVIVMPPAMMLLDVWPLGRMDWSRAGRDGWRLAAEKWAFWMVAIVLAIVPIWLHHAAGSLLEISFSHRMRMIPIHYLFYLKKMLWPTELAVLLGDLSFSWSAMITGLGVLVGLSWGLWRLRERNPWAFMGWIWFIGLLFPLSGVVWAGAERLAIRFVYLPQIGLILAVVLGMDVFIRKLDLHWRAGALACGLVLAVYAGWTLRLLPHWRNSQAIFSRVLQVNPHSIHAFDNLSKASYQARHYSGWQHFLEQFLRQHPRNPIAAIHYGWWMAAVIGKPDYAIQTWQKATGLEPETWDFWIRLEQITNHEKLVDMWRDIAGIWFRQKGDFHGIERLALHWEGRWSRDAEQNFQSERLCAYWTARQNAKAAALSDEFAALEKGWPTTPEEMLGRFMTRWDQGARGYAYICFLDYTRWRPEDGIAFNNMAWLLATAEPDGLDHAGMDQWPSQAIEWAERALKMTEGNNATMWDTLAVARANAGDFLGAVAAAEKGLAVAEQARDDALADRIRERLDAFRTGQPWRSAKVSL